MCIGTKHLINGFPNITKIINPAYTIVTKPARRDSEDNKKNKYTILKSNNHKSYVANK